ncbi:MAG: type II toxin-antitoxin system RelE/ParE family toxin [Patescibacteria group bacterium]
MPNLKKILSKFSKGERKIIEGLIETISSLNWNKLDVKKLKGHQDIFRVRKGDIRIIYRMDNKKIFILAIERRSEKTYKF